MTSDRPYRKGMPAEAAFAEVEKQKGKQFDPAIADRFLAIREEIEQQMQASQTNLLVADPRAGGVKTRLRFRVAWFGQIDRTSW